ncbi:MAG TPA: CRISPR-associated ring nuclease Csm6 [Blastocatellia bacterium]|nr:CRISPR-associated ring nuclease Csm6 [Blastocatellia bacterium]
MNESRNILLCVAGLTPQIITETLYALTQQRREHVDEVRVITTLPGQDKLLKSLLDPQQGKFFAFCRDFGIEPAGIRFDHTSISAVQTSDGRTLDDIRLNEENNRIADRICKIVRALTSDGNTRIHASAAGGRKTMGIFLANAMQLFGRRQDALSHVLVNEPFENHPEFYYPTPEPQLLRYKTRDGEIGQVSTAEARIELADIPFVRLRGALKDWLAELPNSYGEIVERAQVELDLQDAAQDLHLECKSKSLHLLHQKVGLTEREFFFYLLFARARKFGRGKDGFLSLKEISHEELDQTFRLLSRARGEECGVDHAAEFPRFDFLPGLLRDLQLQDEESLQTTLIEVVAKIKAKLAKHKFPDRCRITAKDARIQLRYGLQIAAERIHWA